MKCCGVTMTFDAKIDRHHCMICFGIMSGRFVRRFEEDLKAPTGWPLETAIGGFLDDWGRYLEIERDKDEADNVYRERMICHVDHQEMSRLLEVGFEAAAKSYDTPVFGGQFNRGDPMTRAIFYGVAAMIVASKKGES